MNSREVERCKAAHSLDLSPPAHRGPASLHSLSSNSNGSKELGLRKETEFNQSGEFCALKLSLIKSERTLNLALTTGELRALGLGLIQMIQLKSNPFQ